MSLESIRLLAVNIILLLQRTVFFQFQIVTKDHAKDKYRKIIKSIVLSSTMIDNDTKNKNIKL